MGRELLIYYKKCKTQVSDLNEIVNDINKYENELLKIRGAIAGLSGNGYAQIVSSLSSIVDELGQERRSANVLKDVLDKSVQYYIKTESKILGEVFNTSIDKSKSRWDIQFAEYMLDIVDFRGRPEIVFGRSLFIKGILDLNVRNSWKKILNGTYVGTYWKNGKLLIKLHGDGLTNRQAVQWLKNNLGGEWDKYLAKNLRNNGIVVYEQGHVIRDGMKKFENITDSDLLKYLRELPEAGTPTFGKKFFEGLRFWDDFRISTYAGLDKLARVGKGLNAVGTVFTLGGDAITNFYDPETKEWIITGGRAADFLVDATVDISASAGSAALGGMIGSIGGPVGTVVGAGVGIVVDVSVNCIKLVDVNGDGKNDSLVDLAKIGGHWVVDHVTEKGPIVVDGIVDVGSDVIDGIVDVGSDVIDGISDMGSEVIDGMGGWFNTMFAF